RGRLWPERRRQSPSRVVGVPCSMKEASGPVKRAEAAKPGLGPDARTILGGTLARTRSRAMTTTPKQASPGYSDGHPPDEVHYLESKIILKGDRFTSVDSFTDFARLVRRAAEDVDIEFSRKGFKGALPKIREVLFLDTADFRLYNNAFILRRRLTYEHGF